MLITNSITEREQIEELNSSVAQNKVATLPSENQQKSICIPANFFWLKDVIFLSLVILRVP